MSIYSKLSALLTAANTKTGESDTTLTDAVQTLIDGYGQGGGTSLDDFVSANVSGTLTVNATSIKTQAFNSLNNVTRLELPEATILQANSIYNMSNLTELYVPKLTTATSSYCMGTLPKLQGIVLPSYTAGFGTFTFSGNTLMAYADLGQAQGLGGQTFGNCTSLSTIILRRSTALCALNANNTFVNTRFASGGAGGTIYIPKALYDHLGDNSNLDYKAATNWSTINGYGTITWAKIEGSYYETHYADGTVIPT